MNFNKIAILVFLIFYGFSSFSQGGKHKKIREQIEKEKIKFIISELQLTKEEQNNFLPIYKELSEKREENHIKRHNIMRRYMKNSLNLSDAEIEKMNEEFVALSSELAKLDIEYYNKFKKVLSPRKIMLLFHSEQKFKKHLIGKMHGKMGKKGFPPPPEFD